MTAISLPLENVGTLLYSPERLSRMDRANRVIRLMFNARRKGLTPTAAEAGEICDVAIDQPNLPTKATISKPAATPVLAFIIAANQPAANESNTKSHAITRVMATAQHALARALTIVNQWLNKNGVKL